MKANITLVVENTTDEKLPVSLLNQNPEKLKEGLKIMLRQGAYSTLLSYIMDRSLLLKGIKIDSSLDQIEDEDFLIVGWRNDFGFNESNKYTPSAYIRVDDKNEPILPLVDEEFEYNWTPDSYMEFSILPKTILVITFLDVEKYDPVKK